MKDREREIAERFGILQKCENLEKDLRRIDNIIGVDFDLYGFLDNMKEVIILVEYEIKPSEPLKFWGAHLRLRHSVVEIANRHGLTKTEDRIEDYGTYYYFVFRHDQSWDNENTS